MLENKLKYASDTDCSFKHDHLQSRMFLPREVQKTIHWRYRKKMLGLLFTLIWPHPWKNVYYLVPDSNAIFLFILVDHLNILLFMTLMLESDINI